MDLCDIHHQSSKSVPDLGSRQMFGRECRREGTRNRALVFLARIEVLSRRQNPHPSKTAKGGAARCLQALPHGTKNAATDGPGYRATPRSTTEPHRGWMSDVRHLPSPSPCGRGEVFSLDIPFYRTPPARSYSVMPFQNCEGPVGILSDDRVACLITHCGYIAYSSFLVEP